MISVIVCSRSQEDREKHKQNVEKSIGTDFEYLAIDNSSGEMGICAAYNLGVAQARGNILVFMHEDVFFITPQWGPVLEKKFAADDNLGLVGVAGTQYLLYRRDMWTGAGMPFLRGRVIHDLADRDKFVLSVYSSEKADGQVVAVDGLFFAVRANVFENVRFDEKTFNRFHFYDLDICMQIRKTHRLIVTCDILVKHMSGGNNDAAWYEAADKFLVKYDLELPASCASSVPDMYHRGPKGLDINIKGRIPRDI